MAVPPISRANCATKSVSTPADSLKILFEGASVKNVWLLTNFQPLGSS